MRDELQDCVTELLNQMKGMPSDKIWNILEYIYDCSDLRVIMAMDKKDVREFPLKKTGPYIKDLGKH